jgi:hypothetical protein
MAVHFCFLLKLIFLLLLPPVLKKVKIFLKTVVGYKNSFTFAAPKIKND